ncbi:hypothetical protein [Mariniblastus fucicola]|uniref:Uncharacterized protein n=1 Tax=Mariniblastus fucicola TaxID=980251 RepID=A0A5B9P9W1_9BACT|nr:hypothetical protein [Mariniblastus fucicola]QEG22045.1 hypothetical protein MFFC18_19060 [Mariniblastus fucicola]
MALCSLLALDDLATECQPFFERLTEQYRTGNHKYPVLKVMDGCSDATPEHYVQLLPDESFDRLDLDVLRYVGSQVETKESVRELVRKHIFFTDSFGTFASGYVDEMIDPSVKDELNLLWEHSAAPTGSFFNGDKATAIEKLAAADHSSAYEIALRTLRHDSQLGEKMPAVLLKINATKATVDLCGYLSETSNKKILRAIGIAFRRHGDDRIVHKSIAEILPDASWKLRRAVAFVSGYLSQSATKDWLEQLAFGDRTLSVTQVAQCSIRKHQKEVAASKIADSVSASASHEAWAAIESIVHLVDPSILAMKADPIGFHAIFEELPWCFTKFANKQCEDRAKKIASALDSITNRWDDG